MLNEREKKEWLELEERKIQALEDIAETLEGLVLNLQRKQRGEGQ